MKLSQELQSAIDQIFENTPRSALRIARAALRENYKRGDISPFENEAKRLAYLGTRMPATYAAVHKALEEVHLEGHLLDLGAGPGTASWAALDLFPNLEKITLVEQSIDAITLGKSLALHHPKLKEAKWMHQTLSYPLPKADAAILSYVLNELKEPETLIQSCFEALPLLIIVEPGTPKGFELIRKIRKQLIDLGAHILAPCPHALSCPIQGSDWCHFSARVERSRLHRDLKEGSLGFEDEKFSYLIVSKNSKEAFSSRIIRHPDKQSGFVRLSLCTDQGALEKKTISRKDKDLYRKARKAEWGDPFPM